ncbi:MAG: DUF1460 domain-containing protein [Bacteroidales bacterium]|nr:DUF1460 domain-containing protein [Bacteroidales bacterium]
MQRLSIRFLITALAALFIATQSLSTSAQITGGATGRVRFHNEASDTTRITEILIAETSREARNAQQRIPEIARLFLDAPYQAATLEGDPEMVTIDIDEFDCTSFVETVLALAITADENRSSWRDYVYNLERLRYRNATCTDYASRLHYFSDWVVDNSHRGLIEEVTARIASPSYQVKTLDYMSLNRDQYPALKDSLQFERIKNAEIGYRSHRFPYIKPGSIREAKLQEGDIVAITSKTPGLDVQHMGFIVIEKKVPYLLHASSKAGKVIIDKVPLADYLTRTKNASGIRVVRLKD